MKVAVDHGALCTVALLSKPNFRTDELKLTTPAFWESYKHPVNFTEIHIKLAFVIPSRAEVRIMSFTDKYNMHKTFFLHKV